MTGLLCVSVLLSVLSCLWSFRLQRRLSGVAFGHKKTPRYPQVAEEISFIDRELLRRRLAATSLRDRKNRATVL